jgi:hypothetical protein
MKRKRKILLINGHPDPSPERLCSGLTSAYAQGAQAAGHVVRRIATDAGLPACAYWVPMRTDRLIRITGSGLVPI